MLAEIIDHVEEGALLLIGTEVRWLNPAADYSSAGLVSASVMPWHLVYVSGLILLLGLAALARRPMAPGLRLYGTLAVALTACGGVMQVLAATS